MRRFKSHRPNGPRQPAAAPARPRPGITRAQLDAAAGDLERHSRDGAPPPSERPRELGGPEGPEPTRYGDWERKGICYDF